MTLNGARSSMDKAEAAHAIPPRMWGRGVRWAGCDPECTVPLFGPGERWGVIPAVRPIPPSHRRSCASRAGAEGSRPCRADTDSAVAGGPLNTSMRPSPPGLTMHLTAQAVSPTDQRPATTKSRRHTPSPAQLCATASLALRSVLGWRRLGDGVGRSEPQCFGSGGSEVLMDAHRCRWIDPEPGRPGTCPVGLWLACGVLTPTMFRTAKPSTAHPGPGAGAAIAECGRNIPDSVPDESWALPSSACLDLQLETRIGLGR